MALGSGIDPKTAAASVPRQRGARVPPGSRPTADEVEELFEEDVETLPGEALEPMGDDEAGGQKASPPAATGGGSEAPSMPPPLPPAARSTRRSAHPPTLRSPPPEATKHERTDEWRAGPEPDSGQVTMPAPAKRAEPETEEVEELSAADMAPVDVMDARAEALVGVCEDAITKERDPTRKARLHFEIGRLQEHPLADLRRATAHYIEARKLSPDHLPTLRGARRMMLAKKSAQTALELFDAELRVTPDHDAKAALLYQKGRILEDTFGRRAEAKDCYLEALELAPDDASILRAVEQVYSDAKDWKAVAQIRGRAAQATTGDDRLRAAHLLRRASLLEAHGEEESSAIGAYASALAVDASSTTAIKALKRLYHLGKQWAELVRVLRIEAEKTEAPHVRIAAQLEAARILRDQLGDRDAALAALEDAAKEASQDPTILEALVELYDATGKDSELASALARLAEVVPDPREKVSLLMRLGRVLDERLDDAEGAAKYFEEVRSLHPTLEPPLAALDAIYTRLERWQDLFRVLEEAAARKEDAYDKAGLHTRIALLAEQRLGDLEAALEHHRRAILAVPDHPPAFEALCRLLASTGRFAELAQLHEEAAERVGEGPVAIAHLLRAGQIYEESLAEPDRATDIHSRILEETDGQLLAIKALQRSAARAGRHGDVLRGIELELSVETDDGRKAALHQRAGQTLEDHLGERDAAIPRYRAALELDGGFTPALDALARIFQAAGRWDDLLEVLDRRREVATSEREIIALLFEMGEICRKRLGSDDKAMFHYRRALEVDPTHTPSIRALSRQLRHRGEYAELVEVLDLELTGAQDEGARARTAYRMGQVYEHLLDRADKAITAYEKVISMRPEDRGALDALARLRFAQKSHAAAIGDLDRDAAEESPLGLRVAALVRQGTMWSDHLGEARRAIGALEEARRLAPDHVEVLSRLASLHRQVGDADALAEILQEEARVLRDTGSRVAALRELARLQMRGKTKADDGGRAALSTILELDPNDLWALHRLEEIALAEGDRELLARVDERTIHLTDDLSDRALRLLRRGEYLEQLGDPEAIELYREALRLEPRSFAATRGLSRLAERLDDPDALGEAARRETEVIESAADASRLLVRAARVRVERQGDLKGAIDDLERALVEHPESEEAALALCDSLTRSSEPKRLVDDLVRAATGAKDLERVTWLFSEAARVQADRLDDLPGAIGFLERALKVAPTHIPTMGRLAALFERDGQWSDAVSLLSRIVKNGPEKSVMKNAHMRLATLWDEQLGNPARAMVSLQAVLALDPQNVAALEQLSELKEREGRAPEAIEAVRRLLEVVQGKSGRGRALLRLGRLEAKLGHGPKSRAALAEAISLLGPMSEAAEEFKAQALSREHHERYLGALEHYVEAGGSDAPLALLELARVRGGELEDDEGALIALEEGIDRAPDELALHAERVTRLRAMGRLQEAIDGLRHLLALDLAQVEAWSLLSQTYMDMGFPREARIAAEPITVLDARDVEADARVASIPPRPGVAPAGSLAPGILETYLPKMEGAEGIAELLEVLEPAMPKLYPLDFETYGLSPRDRVRDDDSHPTAQVVRNVCGILGIESLSLYFHRVRSQGVVSASEGNGVALLFPLALAELGEAAQVFLCTRALIPHALGFSPIARLTPRELEVFLASAGRLADKSFGSGLTSEDFLDQQSKRIHRAIPWLSRKTVEAVAQSYIEGPRADVVRWCESVQSTAVNLAAVLADDLAASVLALRRTERDLSGMSGEEMVQSHPLAKRLVAFWASDPAMTLRRRLGVLPGGP